MVHRVSSTRDCELQLKKKKEKKRTYNKVRIQTEYIDEEDQAAGCFATVTWRRANAAQALSIDDGFRSMATNLPISAPLRNNQNKIRYISQK